MKILFIFLIVFIMEFLTLEEAQCGFLIMVCGYLLYLKLRPRGR